MRTLAAAASDWPACGRLEVALPGGARGRPDEAGAALVLLIGLRGADEHGAAGGDGVRFHVVAISERRNFADPCQRIAHYPEDGRVTQALDAGVAARSERGVRFRVRLADALFASDPAQLWASPAAYSGSNRRHGDPADRTPLVGGGPVRTRAPPSRAAKQK